MSAPTEFLNGIVTPFVTLANADGPVVSLSLTGNNDHPQQQGRLRIAFEKSFASEIEIEPGPDCHPKGNIVSQIQQWGPRTPDGKHRPRLTTGIYADNDGGLSAVIDSTTNDPSGSEGQKHAIPLVFNAGEGKGLYVALYPSDNTIDIQDRVAGTSTGRIPLAHLIARLK